METSTSTVSEVPTPSHAQSDKISKATLIIGRVLIALLFILAGTAKIVNPKPFLNHMTEFGVPTFLLPAVIALELGAGLAMLLAWRLRQASAALALFCVLTAVIFHHQLGISAERSSFFKDLAIAGGLFVIASTTMSTRNKSNRRR